MAKRGQSKDGSEVQSKKKTKAEQKEDEVQEARTKARKEMMGYLKFMPDKVKASEEDKATAKRALALYQQLPAAKKSAFVDRWRASKDKQMSWLKDFEETLTKEKEAVRTTQKGLYTRPVVLPASMPA